MTDDPKTARDRAEERSLLPQRYSGRSVTAYASARIAWALLDIADAIREHAAAVREAGHAGRRPDPSRGRVREGDETEPER